MPLSVEMAEASMIMDDVHMSTMVAAKKKISSESFVDKLSYSLAACAAVTAVIAMALASSIVTTVAMCFSLLLSSAATIQRVKLSRQETFTEIHNQLRQEVNRLQLENFNLTVSVDNLKHQSSKLQNVEGQLSALLENQNMQTNKFVDKVKQNKIVQAEIEKLLVIDVMQNVISTIMRADCDQDFIIDPEEVDALILRVKALPGVEKVDEARLKETLLKGGSGLEAVMKMVRNLAEEKDKTLLQVSARGLVMCHR